MGPEIKLVHPGRAAFNGLPMQQSLCGTIGKDPAAPYIGPQRLLYFEEMGAVKRPFFCAHGCRLARLNRQKHVH